MQLVKSCTQHYIELFVHNPQCYVCVCVLLSVEVSVQDAQSSQQEALLAALRANRALLLEQLQTEGSFEEVRRLREEVMAGAHWFSSDTEDTTWGFVQECLLLLLTLARHFSAELKLFNQTPAPSAAKQRTPEMAPPLPPDVLSVTQQKTLGTALQFVVSLGLSPYLAPGVGVPLGCRSAFGAMVEQLVRGGAMSVVGRRLLTTTNILLQLAELSSLATLVFTQHLGDVMAALCQLGYQPHRVDGCSTEEEKVTHLHNGLVLPCWTGNLGVTSVITGLVTFEISFSVKNN